MQVLVALEELARHNLGGVGLSTALVTSLATHIYMHTSTYLVARSAVAESNVLLHLPLEQRAALAARTCLDQLVEGVVLARRSVVACHALATYLRDNGVLFHEQQAVHRHAA